MRNVAFDTETWFVEERHGEDGTICPPLVCGSFADGKKSEVFDKKNCLRIIATLLADTSCRLIGHNIAFDLAVVQKEKPELSERIFKAYEEGRVADTLIRAKLLDIAEGAFKPRGYSLAALAERYFKQKLEKEDTWRLRYKELDGVPMAEWPLEAIEYARMDAEITYKVWQAQEAFSFLLEDQYRQARADYWLYLMSAHGIMTDPTRVAELEKKTQERLDQDRDLLVQHGLVERVYAIQG